MPTFIPCLKSRIDLPKSIFSPDTKINYTNWILHKKKYLNFELGYEKAEKAGETGIGRYLPFD